MCFSFEGKCLNFMLVLYLKVFYLPYSSLLVIVWILKMTDHGEDNGVDSDSAGDDDLVLTLLVLRVH